jgi:hypothetical protein
VRPRTNFFNCFSQKYNFKAEFEREAAIEIEINEKFTKLANRAGSATKRKAAASTPLKQKKLHALFK